MARREPVKTVSYTTALNDYTVSFELPQNYAHCIAYLTQSDTYSGAYPNNAIAVDYGTGNDRCSIAYWIHLGSSTSTNRDQTSAYFPYMSKPRGQNLKAGMCRMFLPNYSVAGQNKAYETWSHGCDEASADIRGAHGITGLIHVSEPLTALTFYPQTAWRAGCTITVMFYGDRT